jgi:curved DNA-binding protein CbpA
LRKIRANVRTVDYEFENCFSNIFKDPKILKRHISRSKNLEQAKFTSRIIPKEAKKNNIKLSIDHLHHINSLQTKNEILLLNSPNIDFSQEEEENEI